MSTETVIIENILANIKLNSNQEILIKEIFIVKAQNWLKIEIH